MKKTSNSLLNRSKLCVWAACLGWALSAHANQLINFQFNEGTGATVTDSASGLTGLFGGQNPAADFVELTDLSPSGNPGDRSARMHGNGFLMADDSAAPILDIVEGPITIEAWINLSGAGRPNEGIAAYGGSYKLGLRSDRLVFTLFGQVDITLEEAGFIPSGGWVHVAGAWDPGVGVHFYVDGVHYFVPDTTPASRPVLHNYLSVGSEGFGNSLEAYFDRVRIHHAVVAAEEIDSNAANPKPPLASTLIAYNFDDASFPVDNTLEPARPLVQSHALLAALTGPDWTNDTPTGLPDDYALSFLKEGTPLREVVNVDFGETPFNLSPFGAPDYTLQAWVKLPTGPMEERRVIYRTDGPAPRISLSINANRTLHTTVLGTADFTTGVSVPNDNRWHHIAVVMEDFERLHFYLDGVLRQTVNRTQTGAPSAGGTPGMRIGKESEVRYFRGLLDRVIVNDTPLLPSQLDYPALTGLPTFDTFDSHPSNVVIDSGSSVTFAANPSSPTAAAYEWQYRANLSDAEGGAIPGATTTSLTLNNVTADDEGFYSLLVTNPAGEAESYRARLLLRESLFLTRADFEAPTFSSGPVDGQFYWTTDQNQETASVLTASEISGILQAAGHTPGEAVRGGSQALFSSALHARVKGSPGLATTTIRAITGFESDDNVTLDVWVRPLGPGATEAPVGNAFFTIENSSGVRAAAFRFGPGNSIDWGTSIAGVWAPSGFLWDENTWQRFTMSLDYTARTYDFFIGGEKINLDPIPFYNANSDSFRQIRIFRGANQAGMILDDLTVGEEQVPAPGRELFWTETGGFVESQGSVWSAAFDGSGKTAVATGLTRPIGIDLDAANGHIYWAEDGFAAQPSQIVRANFDGSERTVLFSETVEGFTNAQMLALDTGNGHVYWADYMLGVIRGNLDGTGYTVLGGLGEQFTALDLDLVNGHIYYGDPTQFGVLFRMDLDGGNDTEIARALAADHWRFNSISLDVGGGHIYYTDAGTHDIKRMDLDGSNQISLLNDPGLNPFGITLGSGDTLYWVGGIGQRLGTAGFDGVSDLNLQLVSLDSTTAFGIAALAPPQPAPEPREYATAFEAPDFTAGISIEGQDSWTSTSPDRARILTGSQIADELALMGLTPGVTVQSGEQALLVSGTGAGSATVRVVSGLEAANNVDFEVWARPLGATAENPIGNVFFAVESTAAASGRAALVGFRVVDGVQTIDYGTAVEGIWQRSGFTWDENSWYRFKVSLDYSARTYDLFINGVEAVSNVPFAQESDSFHQVRIFRGTNQAGMIVDDLSVRAVPDSISSLRLTAITLLDSTVTIQWQGGRPPYQLQRRMDVAEGEWGNVGAPTDATTATETISGETMFYRVIGN